MPSLKRNLFWLLISQAATWVVSVTVLLVAPRVLGDKTFGDLSFVVVYVSFFDLLVGSGINTFLIKAVARDHSSAARYTSNAIALKTTMAVLLTGVAVVLGLLLGFTSTILTLILVYCMGMVISAVGTTVGATLTGLQYIGHLARWNMAQAYVGGIGGVIVLATNRSVVLYAVVFNLAFLVPILPNVRRLRQMLAMSLDIDLRLWWPIFRGGLPYFVLAALLVVYGTIDIPLLRAMVGSEEVGWYALAYRWVAVPALFAVSVSSAFFPALSAEGAQINEAFVSLANRALRLVVFVATPAAVGIALIAGPFLGLLYGDEFRHSVPLLRILALHIPVVGLDIILGSIVMAADRQRKWVMVSVVATAFNPLVNLVAIPVTKRAFENGAIGAAVVTVCTEMILMIGAIRLRPAGVLDRAMVRSMGRIVVASATMIPVVLLLGDAPLGVLVAAGAVTYAVASLALRTVSVAEMRTSLAGLRGRGGGTPVTLPVPASSTD